MGVVVMAADLVKHAAKAAIKAHKRPASMKHYGEGRDSRLLAELLELAEMAGRRPEPGLVGVTLEEMRLIEPWVDADMPAQ